MFVMDSYVNISVCLARLATWSPAAFPGFHSIIFPSPPLSLLFAAIP